MSSTEAGIGATLAGASVPTSPSIDTKFNSRNDFIQYLRGYAAALVVLDHSLLRLGNANPAFRWVEPFAGEIGAFGVQIFFVISGFIMVAISYDDFGKPGKSRSFLGARWKRIAPLYYLATLVALLLPAWADGISYSIPNILLSIVFVANNSHPTNGTLAPVVGVGWTLVYEMFFYAIFAIGLMLDRRKGMIFCFLTIGGLVGVGQVLRHFNPGIGRMDYAGYYTHQIMLLFLVGMVLGIWRRSRYFRQIELPTPATLGVVIGLTAIVLFTTNMPHDYPMWRTLCMFGLATVPVVLCLLAKPRKTIGWAEAVGNASYSMYLFHGFALTFAILAWNAVVGPNFPLGRILLCLATGITTGLLIYHYVELPIVRLLKPRSRQAKQA